MLLYRFLFVLAFLASGTLAQAGAAVGNDFLAATFNDQPLNMQIGTGGALLGQPVDIAAGLQAFVVPPGLFDTPALRITPLATGASRFVRFEFLDNREITAGELRIGFVLRPAQVDRFVVSIRESGGSVSDFMTMTLVNNGIIAVQDAADGAGAVVGNYTAGALLTFELRFNLDARTYDIRLNGTAIATNRNHGISVDGIGAILFGTSNTSTANTNWFIDDVYAFRPPTIFRDGFE